MKTMGGKGKMEVQGETVGWLQGVMCEHARVLQSMCQQHAGIGCLTRIEMFKGLGRRGFVPEPVV